MPNHPLEGTGPRVRQASGDEQPKWRAVCSPLRLPSLTHAQAMVWTHEVYLTPLQVPVCLGLNFKNDEVEYLRSFWRMVLFCVIPWCMYTCVFVCACLFMYTCLWPPLGCFTGNSVQLMQTWALLTSPPRPPCPLWAFLTQQMVRPSVCLSFQQLSTKYLLFSRHHAKNWGQNRHAVVRNAAITQLNKQMQLWVVVILWIKLYRSKIWEPSPSSYH